MRIAKVEKHLNAAYKIVRAEMLKRVMTVMRNQPQIEEFCCAMGSWSFHLYNGEIVSWHDMRSYLVPLDNLIAEYDGTFKLTGDPIKIRRHDNKFATILDW